jgi:hypothetical protein
MGTRYSGVAAMVFLLITLCGSVGMAQDKTEPNAADVYREAFKAMKPIPDDVQVKIQSILSALEYSPDDGVSDVLKSNSKALDLARSASSIAHCRFLATEGKIDGSTNPPYMNQARELGRLLVLRGLTVKYSAPMYALDDFLAARRLAAGLSQDRVWYAQGMSVSIDFCAIGAIAGLLESDARAKVARVLADQLPAIAAGTVSINELLDMDSNVSETSVQVVLKLVRTKLIDTESPLKKLLRDLADLPYGDEAWAAIDKRAFEAFKRERDAYYGRMKRAIAAGDVSAIRAIQKERDEEIEKALAQTRTDIPQLQAEYAKAKGDPAKEKACIESSAQRATDGIAHGLLACVNNKTMPAVAFASMAHSFLADGLFLQACLILAKEKTGTYPDNLAAPCLRWSQTRCSRTLSTASR